MKAFSAGFLATIAVSALAQLANAQTVTCAAQAVFDQCKQNEDNYLSTCSQQDYACLCKWQTAKVSCWDTCPNDPERATQESLRITYCSQPGANVTASTSSAALPASSSAAASLASASGSTSASSAGASAEASTHQSGSAPLKAGPAALGAAAIALGIQYLV